MLITNGIQKWFWKEKIVTYWQLLTQCFLQKLSEIKYEFRTDRGWQCRQSDRAAPVYKCRALMLYWACYIQIVRICSENPDVSVWHTTPYSRLKLNPSKKSELTGKWKKPSRELGLIWGSLSLDGTVKTEAIYFSETSSLYSTTKWYNRYIAKITPRFSIYTQRNSSDLVHFVMRA
jgi:hypothetical protein